MKYSQIKKGGYKNCLLTTIITLANTSLFQMLQKCVNGIFCNLKTIGIYIQRYSYLEYFAQTFLALTAVSKIDRYYSNNIILLTILAYALQTSHQLQHCSFTVTLKCLRLLNCTQSARLQTFIARLVRCVGLMQ